MPRSRVGNVLDEDAPLGPSDLVVELVELVQP